MKIKLILPNKTLMEKDIDKVTLPGREGSFQILPRHIDFTSSIKPGILTVFSGEYIEYFALSHGIMVKKGDVIYLSTLYAVRGESLESLSRELVEDINNRKEYDNKIREILSKMEAETLRRFIELD
ncbi:hypothetical protein [Proteocatella sphenisci]|uniref:hypothetical protein n=1 Tax=Proteocatella sphenisci TaxID=181070 RepID=UPI00048F4675|nr:hypothetical protein [Proteocatella sphenisci]